MDPAPPQHDLVIFDCDGVLVDSEMLSCECLAEAFRGCGIALSVDEILQLFLGRSTAAVDRYLRSRGQCPDAFLANLEVRVRDSFTRSLQPIAGIGAVLSNLRTPFCVASSSGRDRVALALALTGLDRHFGDRVYTAQLVANGKPAPDLFLHAAARMQAAPERTLVVEDSVSGVTAARTAGMTVWGFVGGSHYHRSDGHRLLSDAGADRVFARMADFWNAG